MKFSAQEEYGLRCLIALAKNGAMTIPEIARRESLTEAHIAKLLSILRAAGFVVSTRGQSGGYALGAPPQHVRVGDVIAALGGRLVEDDFCERHSGKIEVCAHSGGCNLRGLWDQVQEAVDSVLDKVTLADICVEETPKVALAAVTPAEVRGRRK